VGQEARGEARFCLRALLSWNVLAVEVRVHSLEVVEASRQEWIVNALTMRMMREVVQSNADRCLIPGEGM